MIPNLRITSLLAEVDRWTGFSGRRVKVLRGPRSQ
jgi:hypothetical protein